MKGLMKGLMMMKLVTQPMNEVNEGKLTVCRTEGPLEDMAFELAAELTANGERLVVVDAAGCFDPSKISRTAATVALNLHVVRTANSGNVQALWPALLTARKKTQARRILIVGMLDHLYGRDMLTRDAARALGRMKLVLEALTRSGLEVVVVCKAGHADLGARTYLLSSLCASAHEVRYGYGGGALTAQHYINGASAAIA
jgi:hypothetical protein